MDPLVSTLILIALALVGARVSFSTRAVGAGVTLVLRTGTHFIFLGLLLGPVALGLFDESAIRELYPLLALALGWIGFLFGLQLDRSILGQFPLRDHVAMVAQAVVAFFVFAGIGLWVSREWASSWEGAELLIWVAAATAATTTPAGIAIVSSNFLVRGQIRRLLLFIASLDAIVGIAALQWLYASAHPAVESASVFGLIPAVTWVLIAVALGVICGLIFLWLTQPRHGKEELVLFLLGVSAFASGAALELQLSPLFVSVVMGAVVANLSPDRERVFATLQRWEKPIYIVFLLLSGALLRLPTLWVVPLGLAYFAVRAGGKILGNFLSPAILRIRDVNPMLGVGLIPQGGIALAMALSGVLVFSDMELVSQRSADVFFAVVVMGVVISELAGPFLTIRVLRRAGEISPKVEEALATGDEELARKAALEHHPPPSDVNTE